MANWRNGKIGSAHSHPLGMLESARYCLGMVCVDLGEPNTGLAALIADKGGLSNGLRWSQPLSGGLRWSQ